MPENKGFIWDPMNGVMLDDNVYYDPSLTEPAVVVADLPAKFHGSQEAARRYAEGYKWGQRNVAERRDQVAPYVAAGLAGTMAAPFVVGAMPSMPSVVGHSALGAVKGLADSAVGAYNSILGSKFLTGLAIGVPAFEMYDRLPTYIGQDRSHVQAGNLAEKGFRAITPDGEFEDKVAPYVNEAGQFLSGIPIDGLGEALTRGAVSAARPVDEAVMAYTNGVKKRAAEAVLRMGDEARYSGSQAKHILDVISGQKHLPVGVSKASAVRGTIASSKDLGHLSKQFLNKNTLRYIFDPKADPNLAYQMPFKYSGQNASTEGAHFGDRVDEFLRKVKPANSEEVWIEDLPDYWQEYMRSHYPNQPRLSVADLGNSTLVPYRPFAAEAPLGVGETQRIHAYSSAVPGETFTAPAILDPGNHWNVFTRTGDYAYTGYGEDMFKWHPEDFAQTNSVSSGLLGKLQKKGLQFIDSQGRPILYRWHYNPENLSAGMESREAVLAPSISNKSIPNKSMPNTVKDWMGAPGSLGEAMKAKELGAGLNDIFSEVSGAESDSFAKVLDTIEELMGELGINPEKYAAKSINSVLDDLEIGAAMVENKAALSKIDIANEILNGLKETSIVTEQYNSLPDEIFIDMGLYEPHVQSELQKISDADIDKIVEQVANDELAVYNKGKRKDYGGLISRLNKHYGSKEKALEVVRKFAEGRKFDMGGPEEPVSYATLLQNYQDAVAAKNKAYKEYDASKKAFYDAQDALPASVQNSPNYAWYKIPSIKRLGDKSDEDWENVLKSSENYIAAQKAIGAATVEKYRGTEADLLQYDDWSSSEEGAIRYLTNDGVRESVGAQEVADYFNSYAASPGFQRIINNQSEWGQKRHPYRRLYDSNYTKRGFVRDVERMRETLLKNPMESYGVFDMDAIPGMGFNYTQYATEKYPYAHIIVNSSGNPFLNQQDERYPYWDELTHEMLHDYNFVGTGQGEALDQNTNAAPGHDSRRNEKHSDLEALRFMLYKYGIYDSRGEKDATAEDIKKLREMFPKLRQFEQMDDETAAWMINHVADANDAVDMSNVAARGGKIHIKPENRGKFTALKKRTGKSASWFKAHGTPAQKKMAVFELNAKKWRHDDGGLLDIDDMYVTVESPEFVGPVLPVENENMIDAQRYAESNYRDNAYNRGSKATGAYQITPVVLKEYTKRTGIIPNLYDLEQNRAVRDWYMNVRLPEFEMYSMGAPSDSNRVGRTYAAFNAGPGAVRKALKQAEAAGENINQGFGFLQYLPQETQDYVNFIVRGKDIPGTSKTKKKYDKAKARKKADGGTLERLSAHANGDTRKMIELIRKARGAN